MTGELKTATLLTGGRVIDPTGPTDSVADVLLEGGRITKVGPDLAEHLGSRNGEDRLHRVSAEGHWVLPGFVDLHVHFREPGDEHKEDIQSGLAASAAGGFTTVCSMPNTRPVNDKAIITEAMLAAARSGTGARLFPFGSITKGLEGRELSEMADLRNAGAVGVTDDGKCVMNAAVMRRAMEYARTFDLLVSQHCEDHDLTAKAQMNEGPVAAGLGLRGWPREAEDIIVARDLILAERTGARYHVAHLSTAGAVRLVREAKARGLPVSAEVTPHHLSLTDEALLTYDTHCKVNPPLRTAEDREVVREALADGTLDCVATDHAPHARTDKECDFDEAAVGINGLETALSVMLELVRENHLTPMRLAEVMATAPCRLVPEIDGGTLREGGRADITVIDPTASWTPSEENLVSKSHNTPFLNQLLVGRVTHTFVHGSLVYSLGGSH